MPAVGRDDDGVQQHAERGDAPGPAHDRAWTEPAIDDQDHEKAHARGEPEPWPDGHRPRLSIERRVVQRQLQPETDDDDRPAADLRLDQPPR